MRTYIDLYGQRFTDARYEWAGVSHRNIMMKSGVSVGDNVGVSNYRVKFSNETPAIIIDSLFLFPQPIDFVSIIDGTVSGSVVVRNISYTDSDRIYLTAVDIYFVKIDSGGTETVLATHTAFSGSNYVVNSTDTIGLMFWFDVAEKQINVDERIGLRVQTVGYDAGPGPSSYHELVLTKNSTDLSISIPTM
jgi:hypothetical protein